eukprot:TRINITY_DN17618_c0_g1_i1.p1 TRINITY_DN17618_c0_g1~~TRINITY_DN17618_c0_g1_i1.p1  ORF type:complete len:145 (+),score=40.11 TRINITY_DN17618_c0_g1_i1:74-508(+)
MIRRPPRSTLSSSSAASDVYKRQSMEFVNGGTAAVLAICCTNPVDVVKTRLQLQGEGGAGSGRYRNVFQALWSIGRKEGVTGLQRGLGPACWWQFTNVSMRFGVYGVGKKHLEMDGNTATLTFTLTLTLSLACLLYTSPSPRDS